nr:hypothetical protein [Tawny frogmouth aviadenovirus A]
MVLSTSEGLSEPDDGCGTSPTVSLWVPFGMSPTSSSFSGRPFMVSLSAYRSSRTRVRGVRLGGGGAMEA